MRILWLLRYPPFGPETGGDAVYSRHLIESTSEIADVQILSYQTAGSDLSSATGKWTFVSFRRRSRILGVLSGLPNVAYRHNQSDYVEMALSMAPEFDAIIVDHIGLFFMVDRLKAALGNRCPTLVLVHHDHEASLRIDMVRGVRNPIFRAVLLHDGKKAALLEKAASLAADGLTAITTTDQQSFESDAPLKPCLLLMPGYDGPVVSQRVIDEAVPPRICILGARGAFHKRLVLHEVLSHLTKKGVQKRFIVDVVGGGRESQHEYPGVNFLGYVNDLPEYMRTVRLGLIPDEFGGGFKVRALTHVFLRVPMLALDSALAGMTLRSGIDYIPASSLSSLIDRIGETVSDLKLLNNVHEAAFTSCKYRFSWRDRALDLVAFISGIKTESSGSN